jgi:DNA adenine methylase
MIQPILKWAGGKRQLLPQIQKIYAPLYGKRWRKYMEPFVGGGAVLCDVWNRCSGMTGEADIILTDNSASLIHLYNTLSKQCDHFISYLEQLQSKYWLNVGKSAGEMMYYRLRDKYNTIKPAAAMGSESQDIEIACLFLFLNRTCFNGLYRVNQSGNFNTPIGRYKRPVICDAENLRAFAARLRWAYIRCCDFEKTLESASEDNFVYLDPPFRPLSRTSNFTAYTDSGFTDRDHIRLKENIDELDRKGAFFILSNSDPKNTDPNDNFFDDLYKDYVIHRVRARRTINSNGSARGFLNELLITNYRE